MSFLYCLTEVLCFFLPSRFSLSHWAAIIRGLIRQKSSM